MSGDVYFSHDANAHRDPKMIALIDKRGMTGYGFFWVVIEMLRETKDFQLPLNKDYIFSALAHETHLTPVEAKEILFALIDEFDLIKTDGEYSVFWSESLQRRMKMMQEKSNQARNAALKRWGRDKKK